MRVDAYFEKGLNAWDHAAGGLIATEAGLMVGGLNGAAGGPGHARRRRRRRSSARWHDLLAELDAAGGP